MRRRPRRGDQAPARPEPDPARALKSQDHGRQLAVARARRALDAQRGGGQGGRRSTHRPAVSTRGSQRGRRGEIAVVQDEGDLVLPPNAFDLLSLGLRFTRNSSGGYDVRRFDASFRPDLGSRVTLDRRRQCDERGAVCISVLRNDASHCVRELGRQHHIRGSGQVEL